MGMTQELLESLAQGSGTAAESTSVITINDIIVLEDERIGVSVSEELDQGGKPQLFEMFYYLVEHENSYLMDDYVLDSAS